MHECPTCEKMFETRRGLGVHHSSIHNERLPNRVCAYCESEFYCEYQKKYCSDSCRRQAVSFEGTNNPAYRGAKKTAECAVCGEEFDYYPSEKRGLYCASCVADSAWQHEVNLTGSDNPRWSGGDQTLECDVCGTSFVREQKSISSENSFCSRECQYKWLSDAFAGDGHPNWKGGGDANYGQGWRRIRRLALERDDYRCRICGTTAADLGRNPDVHHIVPVREFVEEPALTERDAHHLENVISLCIGCHRRAEFGHISRERLRLLV